VDPALDGVDDPDAPADALFVTAAAAAAYPRGVCFAGTSSISSSSESSVPTRPLPPLPPLLPAPPPTPPPKPPPEAAREAPTADAATTVRGADVEDEEEATGTARGGTYAAVATLLGPPEALGLHTTRP
jgi:hypothetical protein